MKDIRLDSIAYESIKYIPYTVDIENLTNVQKLALGVMYKCYSTNDNFKNGVVWISRKYIDGAYKGLLTKKELISIFNQLERDGYIEYKGWLKNDRVGFYLVHHTDIKKEKAIEIHTEQNSQITNIVNVAYPANEDYVPLKVFLNLQHKYKELLEEHNALKERVTYLENLAQFIQN